MKFSLIIFNHPINDSIVSTGWIYLIIGEELMHDFFPFISLTFCLYFMLHLCCVSHISHILHAFNSSIISGRYKINNSWRACTRQKIWSWAIWNANIFKRSALFREPGLSIPLCLSANIFFYITQTHTGICIISCHSISLKHYIETLPIVSILTSYLMSMGTC